MDYNVIMQSVASVGFPIVACVALYLQNDKLRSTIEENTRAIQSLSDFIKTKGDTKE